MDKKDNFPLPFSEEHKKIQTTAQFHTPSLQEMPIKFTTSAYAQWAGRPTA